MHRRILLALLIVVSLLLPAASTPSARAAESLPTKQLAGPAAEMTLMRLPAPDTLGVRSHAAMLPITFGADGVWRSTLAVDDASGLKLLLLSPTARDSDWQLTVLLPDSSSVKWQRDSVSAGVSAQEAAFGLDGVSYPAQAFTFDAARAGLWKVKVSTPAPTANGSVQGFLVVSSQSPYRLYTYVNTQRLLVGREIGLLATLFDQRAAADSARPDALVGTIAEANATLRLPDGAARTLRLFDDGRHADGAAGDGLFGASFVPTLAGDYTAQVTVTGVTPEGAAFVRTGEHAFPVVAANVSLGSGAEASVTDSVRLRVALPVSGLAAGQRVNTYAEVWSAGQPVAWIGGIVSADGASLPLSLDGRWLALAGASRAFELRNVRVLDVDTSIVLAQSEQMALKLESLPDAAKRAVTEISEEMRMGPRPAAPAQVEAPNASRLLLVHGYCSSSNPWPLAQFTNASLFADLNRNRTHDQFANLIKSFGAAYSSFGIVAHSQGGAASLHLYTYYWSGLDYATGPRLIQSVGTPYQGTNLAGNLALLGQIFGAGCGSNYDLTYSGAATWLAGIPSWARAKVYYHTTSFTDVWWNYDYCNIATDPFLSDPEDGVVEKAYGQLSGANNLGHKTGWCHTSGMRDPAQTSDSSRNANMNSNAAR